ncbi:unnamed protein product [Camellia sinensis]
MEWERGKEEALMEDFGCRHKEQWRSRKIVVNYHKAKAALEQLENKKVVAEAEKDEEDAKNEEEEEEIIAEERFARYIDKAERGISILPLMWMSSNMNQWKHSYPTAQEQMKITIERLFLITRICSTTQLPEEDATLPKLVEGEGSVCWAPLTTRAIFVHEKDLLACLMTVTCVKNFGKHGLILVFDLKELRNS